MGPNLSQVAQECLDQEHWDQQKKIRKRSERCENSPKQSKNDPKTIQKRSENGPENDPKRSENNPKTGRKRSENNLKTIRKRSENNVKKTRKRSKKAAGFRSKITRKRKLKLTIRCIKIFHHPPPCIPVQSSPPKRL